MNKRQLLFAPMVLILLQIIYTVNIGQVDVSHLPEVTVYVNVLDASGNPVHGLTNNDFTLTEDGTAAEITGFAGIGDIRPVDIVFVFDTTGSMANEIDGVKHTCITFANKLEATGRDYRLGLVTFGDAVRGVYGSDGELTADVQVFKGWVNSLSADGGDDDPEYSFGAIKRATKMNFRDTAQVIFILITDAPPHHYGDPPQPEGDFNDPDLTYEHTLAIMTSNRSVSLFAVTYNDTEYRNLAVETGGQFYDLESNPDFSAIIDKIGSVISSQYRLTYITPRPSYDGTRRNIRVVVGGSQGVGIYLEPHLINIQSDWMVGLLGLLPLLIALALPVLVTHTIKRQKSTVSPGVSNISSKTSIPSPATGQDGAFQLPLTASVPLACPHCGRSLRSNAKFCSSCGQPIVTASISETKLTKPAGTSFCIHCGSHLQPSAKFCSKCGTKKSR